MLTLFPQVRGAIEVPIELVGSRCWGQVFRYGLHRKVSSAWFNMSVGSHASLRPSDVTADDARATTDQLDRILALAEKILPVKAIPTEIIETSRRSTDTSTGASSSSCSEAKAVWR